MQIAQLDNTKTMSSRTIAEVVKSRHADVMRCIRTMLVELHGEVGVIKFSSTYVNPQNGQTYEEFHIPMPLALRYIVSANAALGLVVMEKAVASGAALKAVMEALQDFEAPDDMPDMYVYAIRNTTTGNIKLGISRDPEQRLKQLQTGNDCRLELVAYKKAENRFKDEARLHHENSASHIRGEWFTGDASIAIQ